MNGNEPAFPQLDKHGTREGVTHYKYRGGLTKREWLAGMALQGLLASTSTIDQHAPSIAIDAAMYADALLAALDQKGVA